LFSNFYSVCNWTNPTIASLFTGVFPQGVFPQARHGKAIRLALPGEIDTLAQSVKKAGYKTAGLVAHPGMSPKLGFDRGFDEYIMLAKKWGKPARFWPRVETRFVRQEVTSIIDRFKGDKFFMYLHLVYPHQPYTPPAPYNQMFGPGYKKIRPKEKQGVINMYDGEIRYTDDLIGAFVKDLKDRDLLNKTYIIITSDHGEAFWEHGSWEHGKTFFNEEIRIPLIIVPPDEQPTVPKKIDVPLSNIDLFPTIIELTGATKPDHIEGKSLCRFFRNKTPQNGDELLFSESSHSYDISAMAVIEKNQKYIYTPRKPQRRHLLYNLSQDPGEKHNLAPGERTRIRNLRKILKKHKQLNDEKRRSFSVQTRKLDKETIQGLKSLGYLK